MIKPRKGATINHPAATVQSESGTVATMVCLQTFMLQQTVATSHWSELQKPINCLRRVSITLVLDVGSLVRR